MNVVMVTRADVERAAWAASGWRVAQAVVEALLDVVDAYLAGAGGEPVAATAEELETLAEQAPSDEVEGRTAAVGADAAVAVEPEAEPPRTCRKCGEVKPVTEFHRDSHSSTGYKPRCKPCLAADRKAQRQARRVAR